MAESMLLFQGAESKIILKEVFGRKMVIKERFLKKYRNPLLDADLTSKRIHAEYRNILRCKQIGVKTPAIYKVDMNNRQIYMEYLEDSKTAKDVINKLEVSDTDQLEKLAHFIGKDLQKMHSNQIIHGDLTSSNILVREGLEITFIDFGLSSVSGSHLDKAVDLYVLERALLSAHASGEKFFQFILDSYEKTGGKQAKEVLKKLEEVRARGRKRTMVG